jgi:thiol:disulfide interchange protein
MMFMILGIGMFLLPILFRLALKLRLGVPMLYALLMLTAFHSWYQANSALADGIFFALVGLVALSWIVTLLRSLADLAEDWREERVAAELLAYRVRQARANGEYVISTEGL